MNASHAGACRGTLGTPLRLTCPICKTVVEDAPADLPCRPFCTQRCKLADLDNWLSDAYRISSPLSPTDLEDDELKLS